MKAGTNESCPPSSCFAGGFHRVPLSKQAFTLQRPNFSL